MLFGALHSYVLIKSSDYRSDRTNQGACTYIRDSIACISYLIYDGSAFPFHTHVVPSYPDKYRDARNSVEANQPVQKRTTLQKLVHEAASEFVAPDFCSDQSRVCLIIKIRAPWPSICIVWVHAWVAHK